MTKAMNIQADKTGLSNAAPDIQRALDTGGHLYIGPGRYRIGQTLRISSNTSLTLDQNAHLQFADGAGVGVDSFLLTNAHHDQGDRNISIYGGIWDGNNKANPRTPGAVIDQGSYTGVTINFRNVQDLSIQNLTLCDAESYFVRASKIIGFYFGDIRFDTTKPRPNNDGIHLGGYCRDGSIERLRGLGLHAPNDDMVALNADDAIERIECQGIDVGPIESIKISDLNAPSCHSFVRLLSISHAIRDIMITKIRGGCAESVINMDGARGCLVPLFDPNDSRFIDGVGDCRDIHVDDIEVFKTSCENNRPLLNIQQRVSNLFINHFRRTESSDVNQHAATLELMNLPDTHIYLAGSDDPLAWKELLGDHALDEHMASRVVEMTLTRAKSLRLLGGGFRRLSMHNFTPVIATT
ncbi:glycosyl hydrolase family 28-related protein [Mucisphaera sp.]|uniref:glycosyl hydrolase family 28-related protein n=1 Tax=Mucisphaera sp. TaxID=2913024 RepID=UPI003D135909